ncbi:MAG TPA: hypothetical protein VLB84_11545 [Bacteroidia bacterium]|jgi:hypothetical protein|nr:hypothetical protein [Bacteroidia bacterium]
MKLNLSKSASRGRVRLSILVTIFPAFIITYMLILFFPDFIDRMSRAIENTELNGSLNENGHTSSFEILVNMLGIIVALILWSYLIRSIKQYRRHYIYDDKKLIREKKYSRLFRTWLSE